MGNRRSHLLTDEQKKKKQMWCCEVFRKDINFKTKSSDKISDAHKESEIFSRTNKYFADKTYTYLNLEFDQKDGLVKRANDDCTKTPTDSNISVLLS